MLTLFLALFLLGFLPAKHAIADDESRIELSGFGRLVGGYLNDEDSQYLNYTDSFSIRNHSLLGLRADVEISSSVSLVAQAILRPSAARDSEVQWLYLDYRPTNDLSFKVGRQRIPFYQYSEIIDVGFAYPWISLPQEVYMPYLFNDYDGLLGSYEFSTSKIFGSIDAYYGIYNDEVIIGTDSFEADVTNLTGLVANVQLGEFNFRASFHSANLEVIFESVAELQNSLSQLGFTDSAQAFTVDNAASFYQVSAGWENIDYFAKLEMTGFNSNAYLIPKSDSFYLSLGYNFYPYTVHLTFGKSNMRYDSLPNEIPLNVSPQIDFLAQTFQGIFETKPFNGSDSITIGLRYEVLNNLALKTDITFINGQLDPNKDALQGQNESSTYRETELLQFSAEWVF